MQTKEQKNGGGRSEEKKRASSLCDVKGGKYITKSFKHFS